MPMFHARSWLIALPLMAVGLIGMATTSLADPFAPSGRVNVPEEDRFAPFATTIHVGETVVWTNPLCL